MITERVNRGLLKEATRTGFSVFKTDFIRFADGSPNWEIAPLESLEGSDERLLASYDAKVLGVDSPRITLIAGVGVGHTFANLRLFGNSAWEFTKVEATANSAADDIAQVLATSGVLHIPGGLEIVADRSTFSFGWKLYPLNPPKVGK